MNFSSLIGLPWQHFWDIKKAQWGEQALTPIYHPEILLQIGLVGYELLGLESRALKILKLQMSDKA